MLDQAQLTSIRSYLEQAHVVTLICGVEPSIDVLAAFSVLNQTLREAGKEVQVVSPVVPQSQIISGLENIETSLGKQNLVVSFPYEETAVDKVSYHIGEDSGQFFLTIKPQKGHEPLDAEKIEFSYVGTESDLIIMVGVTQLSSLEQLYLGYEDFFEKTPILSFTDNGSTSGNINISSTGYSSISECLLVLLNSLQMDFSVDSATNILSAIDVETDYMRSLKASAITFEAVAQLMRLGARRIRPAKDEVQKKVKKGTEVTIASSTDSQRTTKNTQETSSKENIYNKTKTKKTDIKRKKKSALTKKNDKRPGSLQYDPSKNTPRT